MVSPAVVESAKQTSFTPLQKQDISSVPSDLDIISLNKTNEHCQQTSVKQILVTKLTTYLSYTDKVVEFTLPKTLIIWSIGVVYSRVISSNVRVLEVRSS